MKQRRPFVFFDSRRVRDRKIKKAACTGSPPLEPTTIPELRRHVREYEWFVAPQNSSPEYSLGLAVLQRAILDLVTPGTPTRYRKSALDWLNGIGGPELEAGYALSFSRISENLTTMSPKEFRRKILLFAKEAAACDKRADAFRFQRG